MYMFLTRVSIAALMLLLISGCESAKFIQTIEDQPSPEPIFVSNQDRHIFILLNFFKPLDAFLEVVSVKKISVADTFLKKDIDPAPTHVPGKWMISYLNGAKEVLKNTIFDDPLIEEHEYVDEQEGKTAFKHITTHREEASVPIRARYLPEMKYILVEKTDSSGNPSISELFEINQ